MHNKYFTILALAYTHLAFNWHTKQNHSTDSLGVTVADAGTVTFIGTKLK